jgi:hypothetical protein
MKVAGAANVAPADGPVIVTVGGWLLSAATVRAVTFVNEALAVVVVLWPVTASPT